MDAPDALLVLAWVAIATQAFALAACMRVLRFHDAMLNRAVGEPRRVSPGDTFQMPAGLEELADGHPTLFVFGRSGCRSCLRAVEELEGSNEVVSGRVLLIELWATESPIAAPPGPGVVRLDYQQPVIDEMKVGLMPFAVLVADRTVIAAGGIGSTNLVQEILGAARNGAAPQVKVQPRERVRPL